MEESVSAGIRQNLIVTEDTSLPDDLRARLAQYLKPGNAHDAGGKTVRVPIDDGDAIKYMVRLGYRVLTGEALLSWEASSAEPVRRYGYLFLPMTKNMLDEAIRIETSYLPSQLKERHNQQDVFRHKLKEMLSPYLDEGERRGMVMIDEKGRILGYSTYTLCFDIDVVSPACPASIDHAAIRPDLKHSGLLEQVYAHTMYVLKKAGAERITTNVLMNGPRSRRRLTVLYKLGFRTSGSNLILIRDSMPLSRGQDKVSVTNSYTTKVLPQQFNTGGEI